MSTRAGIMSRIGTTSFWIVFAFVAFMAATIRSSIDGDGVEYLLMAHAFATHGTASLNAADFSSVANLLNGKMDPTAHKMLVDAADHCGATPRWLSCCAVWAPPKILRWH